MEGEPRILVTGGAGFIGSHTCKALAESGFSPVAYDNLTTGHANAVRWGPLVVDDLRNRAAVLRALREERIEAVLHFAASAYVGESVHHPLEYYDNNLGGMISLLSACSEAGVKHVVFSSSCATYGVPEVSVITEDCPQRPINPYGRSKLMGETILQDAAAAHGIRPAILRYFNAAGADPDGVLGERHDPETHLIPLALMAAAGRREALEVMGADYPTPDGSCIRDYIHVTDLARAHVLALGHLLAGRAPLTLNLGSGTGHSVLEVVAAIAQVTGRQVPVRIGPRRAGDPPVLVANPSKAARLLGFRTRLSQIETILRHAAPWFGLEVRHETAA